LLSNGRQWQLSLSLRKSFVAVKIEGSEVIGPVLLKPHLNVRTVRRVKLPIGHCKIYDVAHFNPTTKVLIPIGDIGNSRIEKNKIQFPFALRYFVANSNEKKKKKTA
jgi:hypothetical protein